MQKNLRILCWYNDDLLRESNPLLLRCALALLSTSVYLAFWCLLARHSSYSWGFLCAGRKYEEEG
jgi:hypothetical protein